MKLYDMAMPNPKLKVSQTDWRMIKSISYDALKRSRKIAEELDFTVPTVNNRLQRLIRSRTLYVVTIFDAQQASELILYALVFFINKAKRQQALSEIRAKFNGMSYNLVINPTAAVVFLMFIAKIGEPEDNYTKARSIEGMQNVIPDLIGQTHDSSRYIDKLIDQNLGSSR